MIGLFIMYLVGKGFFDLAEKYNKNGWGFAIAGVASYYMIQMLSGFVLGIYWGLRHGADNVEAVVDENYWLLTIATVTVGALGCWAFYEILKKRWSMSPKEEVDATSELLDDELLLS